MMNQMQPSDVISLEFMVAPIPEIEDWEVAIIVADILRVPIPKFRVLEQAGRFVLCLYEPYEKPDPEIVVMAGDEEGQDKFNKLVGDLVRLTNRAPDLYAREWYKLARPYLRALSAMLNLLGALPDERRLVMQWATNTVVHLQYVELKKVPPRYSDF